MIDLKGNPYYGELDNNNLNNFESPSHHQRINHPNAKIKTELTKIVHPSETTLPPSNNTLPVPKQTKKKQHPGTSENSFGLSSRWLGSGTVISMDAGVNCVKLQCIEVV